MRIALFSWEATHSVSVGGISYHVTELACALERKGHEVHLFTRLGKSNQSWHEDIHGVHYHRCPFSSSHDFIEEINNMCRVFSDNFFHLEDSIGKFNIIHAHDWLTTQAVIWIKEKRWHKTILTIHSTEYGRCGNNFFGGDSPKIRDLEWQGIFHADKVIAVSNALKKEIVWIYSAPRDKIQVIYNGINHNDYDGWVDSKAVKKIYGLGLEDPLVLFVGRMVYQKGPDLLFEAVSKVLIKHPKAKFVFVGDGDMRWGIEEKAHSLGVNNSVKFLGHQNSWRLKDLYKSCDVVCLPSRNEPFGIVMLEAWSAGKPVVASSNGGPAEVIWHEVNGYTVSPNPDSLAWGINSCFDDFDHCRWMGRNGRIAAETAFCWDSIANQTLGVYNS